MKEESNFIDELMREAEEKEQKFINNLHKTILI